MNSAALREFLAIGVFFVVFFFIFKAPLSAKSVPIENFSDFLRYFYRVKVLDKTHI